MVESHLTGRPAASKYAVSTVGVDKMMVHTAGADTMAVAISQCDLALCGGPHAV